MAMAQPVTRRELLQAAISGGKAVDQVSIQEVTMDVGVDAPLHLHPCPTMGVVIAGNIAFEIEGEETRHLGAGDAFHEPANVRVAKFNNEGAVPATFVAFYLLGRDERETVRLLNG
jgi:quercetin dioxygenase-like cupin family protein